MRACPSQSAADARANMTSRSVLEGAMKAVVATSYGPPDLYPVADMPVPRPGPGQIQVRIPAASINPADVRLPSGEFRDATPLEFPHVWAKRSRTGSTTSAETAAR